MNAEDKPQDKIRERPKTLQAETQSQTKIEFPKLDGSNSEKDNNIKMNSPTLVSHGAGPDTPKSEKKGQEMDEPNLQQEYIMSLEPAQQKRYNFLISKNLNIRSELIKVANTLDMIVEREKGEKLKKLYHKFNEDTRITELNEEIKDQKNFLKNLNKQLKARRTEIKEISKFSNIEDQENQLNYLRQQIAVLTKEKVLLEKVIGGQSEELNRFDHEDNFLAQIEKYKIQLDSSKDELKELKETYQEKKKESDLHHREIVGLRKQIQDVKTFGRKMRLRERQGGFEFDDIKEGWPILEKDIAALEQEIKDLGAEREHLTAIQEIDRKKYDAIIKEYKNDGQKLRVHIEENDRELRKNMILQKQFERKKKQLFQEVKRQKKELMYSYQDDTPNFEA